MKSPARNHQKARGRFACHHTTGPTGAAGNLPGRGGGGGGSGGAILLEAQTVFVRGWVSATDEMPAAVYAGDGLTTQAMVDLVALTGKSADRVREAFDEPLARAAVLAIAAPYL